MSYPGGPSKYTKEMLAKTKEFYEKYCALTKRNVPFLETLARELKIDEDTVTNWSKEHDAFGAYIKAIKMLQKERLSQRTIYADKTVFGEIFLLNVNHKMVETQKKQFSGEDGKPIRIETIITTDDETGDLSDEEAASLHSQG